MLVVSRKKSEKIVIPALDITIVVTRISGDQVHIGIEAPKNIEVHRQEVWDEIQRERAAADGE